MLVDVHEAFLKEDLFIEEALLSGHLLEACRDLFVAIDHQHYQEIVFGEVRIGVSFERVIIVEAAAERVAKLVLVLVVHGDADGHLGVFFPDAAPGPDFRYHTSVLDLSVAGIGAEACRAQLRVVCRVCQDKGLI